MSEIQNLQAATQELLTNSADSFAEMASALEELAGDIANLPKSGDIDAEAQKISAAAKEIKANADKSSKVIREALPTPEAPTPEN